MIKEAYCSFEVAKLLEEKGFDEFCRSYFTDNPKEHRKCALDIIREQLLPDQILRPTHQMALAWLRCLYIHIEIAFIKGNDLNSHAKCYYYRIIGMIANEPISVAKESYSSYEEAVEAALIYSLKNIV